MDSDGDSGASRDTSPDPITLPSSPLGSRSARKSRDNYRPTPRSSRARNTRSKSVVMDTPRAGSTSPWRIRVTVEAESREGTKSPSKKTRTMTIPLDDSRRSGSPVKRALSAMIRAEGTDGAATDTPRVLKKRKGTPVRRGRSTRQPQPPPTSQQPEPPAEEEDMDLGFAPEPLSDEAMMPPPPPPTTGTRRSASRRSSGRIGILNAQSAPVLRSERLSMAREELDMALQDAVGYHSDAQIHDPLLGDATLSRNEDFSMISVETLQTTKDTSVASILPTIAEGNQSAVSVSHMASSPPRAESSSQRTAPNKTTSSLGQSIVPFGARTDKIKSPTPSSQLTPHQPEPKQPSRHITSSLNKQLDQSDDESLSSVDDEQHATESSPVHHDADLWQDEASRSLEDQPEAQDQPSHGDEVRRSPQLEDLFAGQPLRPARGKIPRTWRRSSGNDFSYVDSPAHEQREAEDRRHSTDGSGVLTPPSTDGDSGDVAHGYSDRQHEQDPQSELTHPDAEATRYQEIEMEESGEHSSVEDDADQSASESVSSEDGHEGTNVHLQNSLPPVRDQPRRRPARKQTMDLTELLNLNGASSPAKAAGEQHKGATVDVVSSSRPLSKNSVSTQNIPFGGKPERAFTEQNQAKAAKDSSKRSLLGSSDLSGRTAAASGGARQAPVFSTQVPLLRPRYLADVEGETTNSFASKASDQQQLLQEMRRGSEASQFSRPTRMEPPGANDRFSLDRPGTQQPHFQAYDTTGSLDDDETGTVEGFRSYEEYLNRDSPQKIRVNFNDSSSLVSLKRPFSVAFGTPAGASVSKDSTTQPSLFSRITATLWSTLVRPSGPTSITPKNYQLPTYPEDSTLSSIGTYHEDTIMFNHDLRTHIRNRYGVVSAKHPWTMTHMRTLHRMLNSLASQRPDSLIPNAGPLPQYLARLVNTTQTSITDWQWKFTAEHAYVIFSFLQVIVEDTVLEAMRMGEVEWLGDKVSRSYRGYYMGDGKHGSDPVFEVTAKGIKEGPIEWEFVVAALGCCVKENEDLEAMQT